ncbi:hypothetical protein [Flaviaesturariibacter amylovorans]|uniref:Cytochrome c domain-containing protein n=1 Tax=Flaviaesturariibacter amylovorans TaxID=1084520 RepID=A0ABP8HDE1_9BACT
MKKTPILVFLLSALALGSCYYDVEEELYPVAGNCGDTTAVTYSGTIAPLLTTHGCTGCHGSTGPSGGVSLNNWAAVKTRIDDGRLVGAISHATGFAPMPQGAPKMSACDIDKIRRWAAAGAPNN